MPLEGLRGHLKIADRLFAELNTRPSHSYLLAGPDGVGKALVARGLAHGLLCEREPGPGFCCTPNRCPVRDEAALTRSRPGTRQSRPHCQCCPACVQTALGVHPDITLVGRQANRTEVLIEQIRRLIANLGLKPSRGARRLAIIDDAETLSIPAQNALLKTLEEPPGHAIIFMVSSSEHALLDTLRSRTRLVRFGPLSVPDIEAILLTRAGVEPETAAPVARLARGSACRAFALLEGGRPPPVKEILDALKEPQKIDFVRAEALAQAFFSSREQAVDNFELIARLLEEILCCQVLGTEIEGFAPEVAGPMAELGAALGTEALLKCMEGALSARSAIKGMANSRLQAEQWLMSAGQAARGEQWQSR